MAKRVNFRSGAGTSQRHLSRFRLAAQPHLSPTAKRRQGRGWIAAGCADLSQQVVRCDLVDSRRDECRRGELSAESDFATINEPRAGEQVDGDRSVFVLDSDVHRIVLIGAGDVPRFHAEPDAPVGDLGVVGVFKDVFDGACLGHTEILARVNTHVNTHRRIAWLAS